MFSASFKRPNSLIRSNSADQSLAAGGDVTGGAVEEDKVDGVEVGGVALTEPKAIESISGVILSPVVIDAAEEACVLVGVLLLAVDEEEEAGIP